ncbi:MAG: chorismate synthase [Campylobacterales bacterium]
MNTFGQRLRVTTFGESHGPAIGCVIDGLPAGLAVDEGFIAAQMARRRPGQNAFATQRNEADVVEILSGVFEGVTTGTPVALMIRNTNQKSGDYETLKHLFRPGHADITYHAKYGVRDYRGGGRSSARETAARVAAGAFAQLMLREIGITIQSGICEIDGLVGQTIDFAHAAKSEIFALDPACEDEWKKRILSAKNSHDSVGGAALIVAHGVPAGLGEPLYYKLDALLAAALMGINGVKAVDIGDGRDAARMRGSQNNDPITPDGFFSNHAGGVLGGISTGAPVVARAWFKPTPSIFLPQQTITTDHQATQLMIKGRHDPCIAIRGSVVAEAMVALTLADLSLLNLGSRIDHLKTLYQSSR